MDEIKIERVEDGWIVEVWGLMTHTQKKIFTDKKSLMEFLEGLIGS